MSSARLPAAVDAGRDHARLGDPPDRPEHAHPPGHHHPPPPPNHPALRIIAIARPPFSLFWKTPFSFPDPL